MSKNKGWIQSKKIFLLGAFVFLTVFFEFGCVKTAKIQGGLFGMWETSAPKYEGCYFSLGRYTLDFRTKEETTNTYYIKRIKRRTSYEEGRTLYIIIYENKEGQEMEMPLYYYEEENAIRFKNQEKILWTRR